MTYLKAHGNNTDMSFLMQQSVYVSYKHKLNCSSINNDPHADAVKHNLETAVPIKYCVHTIMTGTMGFTHGFHSK